jgi:hypothetical protein
MRVGEALRPRLDDRVHAPAVLGVPDQRVPIGVEDNEPAPWTQDAVGLAKGLVDVIEVLVDLSGRECVEGCIVERERASVTVTEREAVAVRGSLAVLLGDGEHVSADVDAGDVSVRCDVLGEFNGQVSWAGPDVEDPLALAWR